MEGYILMSYPKEVLNEIWRKLAINFIGLFTLVIIEIASISTPFSNKLLNPLRDLQRYTRDIFSGKSDDTLTITSIHDSGTTFNLFYPII